MPWSKEQQEAIEVRNKDILVAAAAGSGKTAVLVERIIQLVLKDNIDINKILVVTFTNAAATEMRQRIARQLEAQLTLAAEQNDIKKVKKLERQLILLNAAAISTMHSFCQGIVRQYFNEINVDPKFRLASQQEVDLLKYDVLEVLIQNKYEEENNALFLQFVDSYGNEKGDGNVYEIILNLYEYAVSQPFPEKWLKSIAGAFDIKPEQEIETTLWAKIVQQQLQQGLDECLSINRNMAEKISRCGYEVNTIESDYERLTDLASVFLEKWTIIYDTINILKFERIKLDKDMPEELKDWIKNERQKIKEIIGSLQESFFQMPPEKLLADLAAQKEMAELMGNITLEFMEMFNIAKHEKNIADFNDLEHFALQILADKESTAENLIPTSSAVKIQKKYQQVMVDEYQDTNGVQEAIISLAAGNNHNKFLVGDVKQSIYRFRLAEPELFLSKYRQYPQEKQYHQRIDLAKNFRSRKNILQAVNFIFAQLMTAKAAEIDYGEKEALDYGFDYPENENSLDGPVELLIVDKDGELDNDEDENTESALSGFAAESEAIAKRIKELINSKTKVYDKNSNTYRTITYKDIVVLMRSVSGKADIMLETLRNNDIPSYAAVSNGYFAETEIRVMLALLKILDNPRQDIPLAAVLYSPIVDIKTQELAQIRLCMPAGDLFDALLKTCEAAANIKESLKNKIADFLQKLTKWRSLARQKSVPELIWQLYDDTGYYDYCGGMPGGLLRQANLRMLYDRAATYEETDYRGLFRFLQFIERMQKKGNDLSVARTLGENEDVVRIMTIHKSKGLEFPVVIIADLGKRMNMADSRQDLLIHKKYGIGPYVYDTKYNVRYPTLARQAVAQQIINESKAEELRVLYVAMTRAREKLILTGSVKNIKNKAAGWCQNTAEAFTLPEYKVLKAATYLDWICMALARHKDAGVLYEINKDMPENVVKLPYADSIWQINLQQTLETIMTQEKQVAADIFTAVESMTALASTDNKEWVRQQLEWRYPWAYNTEIPSKLSVTEIKRRFETAENAVNIFKENDYVRPRFLQDKMQLSGAEYGTIVHSVMQHLELDGNFSDAGIKAQLDKMAQNQIIMPEQVSLINRRAIRNFIYSPLGKRVLASNNVRREMQFSRMLEADKYYDVEAGSKIFIQGVVDLLFSETDKLILVDYKTDNCTSQQAREKYKVQINLYSEAVAAILQQEVTERYLYLFHSGDIVQI